MAVTPDAVGPAGGTGAGSVTSPVTWTHITGVTASLLLVGVSVDNTTVTAASPTASYNGVSMGSPILTWPSGGAGQTVGFVALFAMASPPSGSHTVSCTFAAGDGETGGSASYIGHGALGTPVKVDSAAVSLTSGSVAVTGTAAGSLVFAVVGNGSDSLAFTAGTSRYKFAGAGSGAATSTGGADIAGGGTVTVSWTQASDFYAAIAVEIQAAGGSSPRRPDQLRTRLLVGAGVPLDDGAYSR